MKKICLSLLAILLFGCSAETPKIDQKLSEQMVFQVLSHHVHNGEMEEPDKEICLSISGTQSSSKWVSRVKGLNIKSTSCQEEINTRITFHSFERTPLNKLKVKYNYDCGTWCLAEPESVTQMGFECEFDAKIDEKIEFIECWLLWHS